MRSVNLNPGWKFFRTKAELEKHTCTARVDLPHTWNAADGQDGGNDYYRGTCWYERELPAIRLNPEDEVYLQFDGVAMNAEVFVNGQKMAEHHGGYSTFRVHITGALTDSENTLLVSVNNAGGATYPQNADFTFYGGIYRDVQMLVVPKVHFDLDSWGSSGLKVTPIVTDLKNREGEVTLEAWVTDGASQVRFEILAQDGQAQHMVYADVKDGCAKAAVTMKNVHLWDGLIDPWLYEVRAGLENGETVSARFGFRQFAIDPQKGFILNGRSYPLRGVSRHQDRQGVGTALTREMHEEDMRLILEVGANTVRLAHYQHAQAFYDLCDENGIVVWAEIPYITMHMSAGRENTLSQMTELISQCYNHPSIVCWGLSNEITVASTVDEALLENHQALNELCHRMDKTRPTTMASAFMLEIDSPILSIPDVNSYNLYFGWYLNELEDNETFFDTWHQRFPDRPIGFSEYGADANIQFHNSHPDKGDYSEEYQCVVHEHILNMLESRPWIWASHVWNMFDFAADGRDEGGAHGLNQKGLVTFDRKTRKDAFYLYKAFWSDEPFVHIAGRRYINRPEAETEIRVYSNESSVTLYVDGKAFATQTGSRIFRFLVPLTGEHEITAKTFHGEDRITVRRVEEPDPSYKLLKQPDVINWFDRENYDPACYSVLDTVGEITQNPEANEIYLTMKARMDAAVAARGDIAQSATGNPALQKMINRQTFRNLIKLCGLDLTDEELRQLNYSLQQIRKGQEA